MTLATAGGPAVSLLLGTAAASTAVVGLVASVTLDAIGGAAAGPLGGPVIGIVSGLMIYRQAGKWHAEDRAYLAAVNEELRTDNSDLRGLVEDLDRKSAEKSEIIQALQTQFIRLAAFVASEGIDIPDDLRGHGHPD